MLNHLSINYYFIFYTLHIIFQKLRLARKNKRSQNNFFHYRKTISCYKLKLNLPQSTVKSVYSKGWLIIVESISSGKELSLQCGNEITLKLPSSVEHPRNSVLRQGQPFQYWGLIRRYRALTLGERGLLSTL